MQITKIAALLSLALPAVLADGQVRGAGKRRDVGVLASTNPTVTGRSVSAPTAVARRSPHKSKSGDPFVKTKPGQSQQKAAEKAPEDRNGKFSRLPTRATSGQSEAEQNNPSKRGKRRMGAVYYVARQM
uniref:Uncharacterized protein n=1 Tax=Pyricularia oryzae (strain 70-15 / ATCC MYA-4617 / FGSC 8958) TaxID=242507 RepID=Q2KGR5_PYRO7|nr:hypothetical protein MGCH7_ch7g270 [Pyricularia oryzae 70-15]